MKISANTKTLKNVLEIKDGYQIDIRQNNSISSILGFQNRVYDEGFHESENVNILSINSNLVNVNVISGSYVNGRTQNTIFLFFPNVPPGYKIVIIILDTISKMETIADQNGKQRNLRGENLTIRLHLRQI